MATATTKPTSPAAAAGSSASRTVARMRSGATEKVEVLAPTGEVGNPPPLRKRRPEFALVGGVVCRPAEAVAYDLRR